MSKPKSILQQSDKNYGGFYRLVPAKNTVFESITRFTLGFIKLPYNIYQTIVGRLLSYLVINPLFRKQEKDESLILQHPKHPDPLFTEEDEMTVVNVYSSKHVFFSTLLNWHNYIVNHLTPAKWLNSIFNKLQQLFPSSQTYTNNYLDKLVDKIGARIDGAKGRSFHPSKIHFRGIEKLSAEQQEAFYLKLEQRFGYDFRQNRKEIYFYTLQTLDNSKLDSVEVRNQGATTQKIGERRFIITSMPRSNNFVDWLKHYKIYAKELNATVIAFNYRGVGASKGLVTSENDLYNDAYAQAQRLLKLGAKPENIALMGECLGGNIATHTAGTLHEEGFPVKLFSARSFRSLTSIMEGPCYPYQRQSILAS